MQPQSQPQLNGGLYVIVSDSMYVHIYIYVCMYVCMYNIRSQFELLYIVVYIL